MGLKVRLFANAIPTAEAALEIAMGRMPVTLHGCGALVIGCGRIGKLLCGKLLHLGARVTGAARKKTDCSWMDAQGIKPIHTMSLDGTLDRYDVIFNTIPHLILTSARLRECKPSCVIIDLASAPGGTDFKAAERLGLNCVWALGLPGKHSPESAARYMLLVLDRILTERGVEL
jgi:dipicolinate synthase subunit A